MLTSLHYFRRPVCGKLRTAYSVDSNQMIVIVHKTKYNDIKHARSIILGN